VRSCPLLRRPPSPRLWPRYASVSRSCTSWAATVSSRPIACGVLLPPRPAHACYATVGRRAWSSLLACDAEPELSRSMINFGALVAFHAVHPLGARLVAVRRRHFAR